jgi:nitric oxide reductase activation protein
LADPNEQQPPEGSGSAEAEKQAHKAEQVETPDNKRPMLAMFRAESLPTWAEYVRVNRAFDEDEDPNAKDAAKDLDKLSLTRWRKRRNPVSSSTSTCPRRLRTTHRSAPASPCPNGITASRPCRNGIACSSR